MASGAQTTTVLIESASAKLFTIVYRKQHAETVILLHGEPGPAELTLSTNTLKT
jgi:hypothetical protein